MSVIGRYSHTISAITEIYLYGESYRSDILHCIPSSEQAKINEYKQRIATIDIDIQKLLDACLTSGDVAVKYLNERIDLLDTEKQNLQAEILAIQNKSNRKLELEGLDINSAPTALAGGEFDTKKYLCNFFIEQIIFYDRDNVQIRYKM